MSDYTKTTNFTAKDALSTGDPLKLIKGSYFDTEYDNIATAITSKYDSNDIASQAQAEALASNTVLLTPASAAFIMTQAAGAGIAEASGVLSLDINGLAADTPVVGDYIAFEDIGGGADNKCTLTTLIGVIEGALTITESQISDLGSYYASGDSPTFGTITTTGGIELGHASDTTITRSTVAGKIEVENKSAFLHSSTSYDSSDVTYGTGVASGGSAGDVHFQYTA